MNTETKTSNADVGVSLAQGGVALRHGSGASTTGDAGKRVMRLHDLLEENSNSVYVVSNASKITKKVTHVLIPHKSSQSGDTFTIEIPNTFIPIDLASFAPKEELIKNPTLMSNINSGILTLLSTDAAHKLLDSPDARRETERLMTAAQRRLRSSMPGEGKDDGPMRAMIDPNAMPQPGAPGDINVETAGVSASVVALFAPDFADEDRVVMLRNIVDTLSDADKRYVRGKTNDARIRELVG